MSVDLEGIIGHRLSKKELLELPAMLDICYNADSKLAPSKWTCDYEMTEDMLEAIWQDWEQNKTPQINQLDDNKIMYPLGWIYVWRNTIVIRLFNHHYYNLCDPVKAEKILMDNRIIAKNLGASHILYTVDSSYETARITDKVLEGFTIGKLIAFGIREFGMPPKPVAEGVKYMFFIDNISVDLGELNEWDWNEDKYWKYNSVKGSYELKAPGL